MELAWLLPRYQPDYKPLARWKAVFDPAAKASGARRKKAVVALARRLAVDLWRIRTGRACNWRREDDYLHPKLNRRTRLWTMDERSRTNRCVQRSTV
ncbi:MAG TPA: hypothetical protein VN541_23150 [Tepidisphaeraceae bacterium]|nr:hypothetical protein [Tepidisphaeraceae bacterium]